MANLPSEKTGLAVRPPGKPKVKRSAVARLVATAIILVFVALFGTVLVMLMNFVSDARLEACIDKVKELCQANQCWAATYHGALPPADSWPELLLKSGLLSGWENNPDPFYDPGESDVGRAYAMNALLDGKKLPDVRSPSETVMFFECRVGSPPSGGPELLPLKPRHEHAEKYVIGFCDGHVEAVEHEKVNQLIWDPNAAPPGE